MSDRPSGTITFLFSDIEGSTRKWEQQPEAMRVALGLHDRLLRAAFEAQGGFVFKTIGDAFCVAFDTPQGALIGAVEAQRALHRAEWAGIEPIKVRMALHTGTAEQRDGDYFGPALNRVSRILSSAHGGQVLLSLPTEELVRDFLPPGVQLRALGEHRLRDLARPEHLFQIAAHDFPSQFPALRSLESVPNNLPLQITSFIGREREMEEVKRMLGGARLLTLTGMGGTGKTRLSLQVAAELFDTFPDGVWFVEFATIADSDRVEETVAGTLEVRPESGRSLTAALATFLRDKRALLVFDNCEHVVAGCARLAEALLRGCPRLRILASSREPLGIPGERSWTLPPLSLPDHWRDLAKGPGAGAELGRYEAVRLFAERAAAVHPPFRLTEENTPLVAQICWRLDGIALAIELAAARVRVLTLEQIVERLDDRFHLLTTGGRTAVPRQKTLRALIDWSHELLNDAERMLLRRLSVFARGRSLEAIEAVCTGHGLEKAEIVDLLSQLVDKSLLTMETSAEGLTRYFMLESIWDYSREKLAAAGEDQIFRERHLGHFLAFAEEAAPELRGPEQRKWLRLVEQEEMNLRFALESAEELPGQIAKGLRLLTALQRFIEVRGLFTESREVLSRLLAHAEAAPRDRIRARALAVAGRWAWITDQIDECVARNEEALAICGELDDAKGTADLLADLGLAAMDRGDLVLARQRLAEAEKIAHTLASRRVRAHVAHVQAALAAHERRFEVALRFDEEALMLCRQLGDVWQSLVSCWSAGLNAVALGRFDLARQSLSECFRVGHDLGNRWGAFYPLEAFAALAFAEGRYEDAARLWGAAESQRHRVGIFAQSIDHPAAAAVLAVSPGFDARRYPAAHAEGRTLGLDAAIALALHPASTGDTEMRVKA